MELPHLGHHCEETTCRRLDFLPMKCDACHKLFCTNHLLYDRHQCESKHTKDVQVPVCPLCNVPVPIAKGTLADVAVTRHIDQACAINKKEKVFSNRCSKPKCKRKELIKCVCEDCFQNFCLAHRHAKDHQCQGNRNPRTVHSQQRPLFSIMTHQKAIKTQ